LTGSASALPQAAVAASNAAASDALSAERSMVFVFIK